MSFNNPDAVIGANGQRPLATSKNEILEPESTIAREACAKRQPMPLNGADAETVADCCEIIAEAHANARMWNDATDALRMACWYYRKTLAERAEPPRPWSPCGC